MGRTRIHARPLRGTGYGCWRSTSHQPRSCSGSSPSIWTALGTGRSPTVSTATPSPLRRAAAQLPAEDDGSRDDALLGQNLRNCTGYQPDVDALRAASTRIVMARGEASGQTMPARGAVAVAIGGRDCATLHPAGTPSHPFWHRPEATLRGDRLERL